jgi:hypothetical protein
MSEPSATPQFPSAAAEAVFNRRGTFAAKCADEAEARIEIQRLLDGIAGFENCTIMSVERVEAEDLWNAILDDADDDQLMHSFVIFDDGSMDWD